jgi:hypothetical protein
MDVAENYQVSPNAFKKNALRNYSPLPQSYSFNLNGS